MIQYFLSSPPFFIFEVQPVDIALPLIKKNMHASTYLLYENTTTITNNSSRHQAT